MRHSSQFTFSFVPSEVAVRILCVLFVMLFALAVMASRPGQPLDCADWQFFEPGFSCVDIQRPCTGSSAECDFQNIAVVDNEGNQVVHRNGPQQPCGSQVMNVYQIVARDGQTESIVAEIAEQCADTGTGQQDTFGMGNWWFDEERGRLIVQSSLNCNNSPDCYEGFTWIFAIEGFTTTFEILQTYTPDQSVLGFRVPYMPEGFERADYFDTYAGQLTKPLDLSQAQPSQCNYPQSQPQVGDYLTFPDSAVNPSPGQASYYLTAVTHLGERRVGRHAVNGLISGRPSSVLPVCTSLSGEKQ